MTRPEPIGYLFRSVSIAAKSTSPNNFEKIRASAKEAFELTKTFMKREGFTEDFKQADGRRGAWKLIPPSPINAFVYEGPMPMDSKTIADKLWSWREKEWKKYDTSIISWNIVQEIDETMFVVHQAIKLSDSWLNPIWDRDLSILFARFEENGTHYIVIKSIDHPKIPDLEKEKKICSMQLQYFFFCFCT